MRSTIDTRLSRLEARQPAGRMFCIWREPKTQAELEVLYRERGIKPGDVIVVTGVPRHGDDNFLGSLSEQAERRPPCYEGRPFTSGAE